MFLRAFPARADRPNRTPTPMLDPSLVHTTLSRHQLADGFEIVVDLERSHGSWLRDAISGDEYLDAFTCFASWPLGYNHPKLGTDAFRRDILLAGSNNPSNSDLYSSLMAEFVASFATRVTPEGFPHHFWVAGGALAVENAMKVAFDWKARRLGRTDLMEDVNDLVILHFRQAFHGRSGYTLSVTNTLPDKVGLFPKFPWPRVHNPFIVFDDEGGIANDIEAEEARAREEIELAFRRHGRRIAAILLEPMQGEGGDNHFRTQFLRFLREIADRHEALLIFDEVQTGFFGSGRPWLWQHHGVRPDIVAFGKKTQVCGLYAGPRVDEVQDNVFRRPSRINSTWGGNLVDMVRCRHFIQVIHEDGLAAHIAGIGREVIDGLRCIARTSGGFVRSVRGLGSLIAFTLPSDQARRDVLHALAAARVLALPCGSSSVRFRLPLTMTSAEAQLLVDRTEAAVRSAKSGSAPRTVAVETATASD